MTNDPQQTKSDDVRVNRSLYNPRIRRELDKRWKRSLWRFLPRPVAAFAVTYLYYEFYFHTPDALYRALAPVLTVFTFILIGPLVHDAWRERERLKIAEELEKDPKSKDVL